MTDNIIITVTGPSGSGKTSLLKKLVLNHKVHPIISTTTREMRPNERQGVDYHFVSPGDWHKLAMVESTRFGGNNYGLSHDDIMNAVNEHPVSVVIVDCVGASTLKRMFPKYVFNLYIEISTDRAKAFLVRRDGEEKATKRQEIDAQNGLLATAGYDCVLKNDSTMSQLYNNFLNFAVAAQHICKMKQVKVA